MRHTHTHTEREREREAETQAEGEAGSMQGARRGTRSWVFGITPWAEGSANPLSHPGCPSPLFFNTWKKQQLREVKEVARGHTVNRWGRLDSNLGWPVQSPSSSSAMPKTSVVSLGAQCAVISPGPWSSQGYSVIPEGRRHDASKL